MRSTSLTTIHLFNKRARMQEGQATVEYALVLLAAAGLAGALLAWAAGSDGVPRLMNAIMDTLITDASP